ncbi:MAG: RecQ family ATP-dependent DNA helicase [Candidatus Poribacteria bacterium]|nr:RecQ family ATP-dependent DNA helicase [Candidatus Poribacteria bacterium]
MQNLQDLLKKVDAILDSADTPEPTDAIPTAWEPPTDRLLEGLETHFGYGSFREGQRQIIEAILDGENVFAVFPTGHGKSMCYQLPALMLDGITVVVSPLISLMKDQVDGLRDQGIEAVSLINSALTWEEYQGELARLRRNEIKLLYISPERLRSRRFLDILNAFSISLFVIDEAHCISQWGRDFRPAYLSLRDTIDILQPRVIALFTATAPPEIQEDILNVLNIPTPHILTQGISRPNLKLCVQSSEDEDEKYQQLEKFLTNQNAASLTARLGDLRASPKNGIIYAGRRRETEEIADFLQRRGFRADFYHAGLEPHERNRLQEAFFDDSENGLDIVVATNAFGMGIDKRNIRYIVHWTLTGTLEEYCQEIGRAGRDEEESFCVLLFCHDDRGLHEWFIKESAPDKPSLLKLLKIIENFRGSDRYRAIANDELQWMSGAKEAKVIVCLSYLEKLGFLKRWYNVPSQLSVRFRGGWIEEMEPTNIEQRRLFDLLRRSKSRTVVELSEAAGLNPKEVMEQLAELQSDGYIQYWGQEDLLLIELLQDSELLSTLTDEQIEVEDYIRRKQNQIDQVVFYALETTCRTRVIRKYFGEEMDENYRCGTCDVCQNSG